MKKILLSVAVAGLLGFMPAKAFSWALVIYDTGASYTFAYSGDYLGTIVPTSEPACVNDNPALIQGVLNTLQAYSGFVPTSCAKADEPAAPAAQGNYPLFVTYADGGMSGPWSTYDSILPALPVAALVDFYALKKPGKLALYAGYPSTASAGIWDVSNLYFAFGDNPFISRFTGYLIATPVPEPATVLLLGVGLVGLVSSRRQRK